VDIRAAVIKDDKILLVNEKVDGKWALPGGWANVVYSIIQINILLFRFSYLADNFRVIQSCGV